MPLEHIKLFGMVRSRTALEADVLPIKPPSPVYVCPDELKGETDCGADME